MKAKILFWIFTALCVLCCIVSVAGVIRSELYVARFFLILSMIFFALMVFKYVDVKTTDV